MLSEDSDLVQEKKTPRAPRKPNAEASKKPMTVKRVSKAPAESKKEVREKTVPQKETPKHEKKREKEGGGDAFHPKIFAVVRIRGSVGITKDLADTLMMLRLHRINHCVIVLKNQNFDGMLHKARNFITWGEINKETLEKLVAKRGRFAGDKRVTDLNYAKELAHLILSGKNVKETGIKPVFRLSPPSKGYKSTKALFPKGSLGYMGERINELLKRMI